MEQVKGWKVNLRNCSSQCRLMCWNLEASANKFLSVKVGQKLHKDMLSCESPGSIISGQAAAPGRSSSSLPLVNLCVQIKEKARAEVVHGQRADQEGNLEVQNISATFWTNIACLYIKCALVCEDGTSSAHTLSP